MNQKLNFHKSPTMSKKVVLLLNILHRKNNNVQTPEQKEQYWDQQTHFSVRKRIEYHKFLEIVKKIKTKQRNDIESTNYFLSKYVETMNIEPKGVWSISGKPFEPRLGPDLTLVDQALQKQEERRLKLKRKNTQKAATLSVQTKRCETSQALSTTIGKQENLTLNETNELRNSGSQNENLVLDKDLKLSRFPKQFLEESEMRYRQAKVFLFPPTNRFFFSKNINEFGKLFGVLNIPKQASSKKKGTKPNMKKDAPAVLELQKKLNPSTLRLASPEGVFSQKMLSSTNCTQSLSDKNNSCTVSRKVDCSWNKQFIEMSESLQVQLFERLCKDKYDRIEVYQDTKCLRKAIDVCLHPKQYAALETNSSIWSKAKLANENINNENELISKKLYRKVLVFVERLYATQNTLQKWKHINIGAFPPKSFRSDTNLEIFLKKSNIPKDVVKLVADIREMLNQGCECNESLFYQCLEKTGEKCLQSLDLLQVFGFLRKYFNVKPNDLNTFICKKAWNLSPLSHYILMCD
ncbi:hypothetical protein RFI_27556 [Reticulomyxa filosa]|uniref:Uncharacterized protein n=1 Tax=Reticulomyxa filosa TaxID=46433 RepID=X6M752_RETFI|nr:hypothetical protein RFI_27556 [Reticulomyxa filosa]|eukprot:ETO09823.1 hypothetical protein RFI_27556 [Reticulomyxa filosa]